MTSFPQRRWIYIGLVLLIGLILLGAPQRNPLTSGSTYNRSPDGYGAWYAYMEENGHSVQRWQKPSTDIVQQETPQTFLQIAPPETNVVLRDPLSDWIQQGNTWVLLEEGGFPTEAPFTTTHETEQRPVKLETTKRHAIAGNETSLLGDRFGAIIWQEPLGDGRIIHTVSPFLAANAYQDEPGNFAYLASLISQDQASIWIDETIHGYMDTAEMSSETSGNWAEYLANTPLLPALIQTIVILLVLIGAHNRRFGPAEKLQQKSIDNSEAYIQALAGVLEKAERSEFVLDVIGHETQLQLQRDLGLGYHRLDREALLSAWTKQTGRPAEELAGVLEKAQVSHLKRRELLAWIQQIQQVQDATKTVI